MKILQYQENHWLLKSQYYRSASLAYHNKCKTCNYIINDQVKTFEHSR